MLMGPRPAFCGPGLSSSCWGEEENREYPDRNGRNLSEMEPQDSDLPAGDVTGRYYIAPLAEMNAIY